jgi:hypothetical protein
MKKILLITLASLFIFAIAPIVYLQFFAPSAYSLLLPPLILDPSYNAGAYKDVEAQIIKDLKYSYLKAWLTRTDGKYYSFALTPTDNGGGGLLLIAYLDSTGHFIKIWDGKQNPPDCGPIDAYKVPAYIEPNCTADSKKIDRSNLVRRFFSQLDWSS